VLNEFYGVAFLKKLYTSLDELQTDLKAWLQLVQYRAHLRSTLLLRQDADANLHGFKTTGQG
jgi:hypothetical protein